MNAIPIDDTVLAQRLEEAGFQVSQRNGIPCVTIPIHDMHTRKPIPNREHEMGMQELRTSFDRADSLEELIGALRKAGAVRATGESSG